MSRPNPRRAAKKRAQFAPSPNVTLYSYTFTPDDDGDPVIFRAPGDEAAKAYCLKRGLGTATKGKLSGGKLIKQGDQPAKVSAKAPARTPAKKGKKKG